MTIAEAIQYFKRLSGEVEQYAVDIEREFPIYKTGLWKDKEFLDVAIAALRAQQERENPKPLTLDELREMNGEPVWVVQAITKDFSEFGGDYGVVDYMYRPKYDPTKSPVIWMVGCDQEFAPNVENYGKTWLVYRHRPKEKRNERMD